MKRSEYRIALELGGSHGACRLDMKRSDTYRRIHIDLTDGGKPYPISDACDAVFLAQKPDGTVIYNRCAIRDGAVEYDITPQTTAVTGILPCEVRLYDRKISLEPDAEGKLYLPEENVHLLTTATFTVYVHDSVYDGQAITESANEVTELDGLVTRAIAAISDAQTIRQAKEDGEFDGISITHHWNGTNLVLTSASGPTSTDLRGPAGPRGEKGEQGEKGEKGDPGNTVNDASVGREPWSSEKIMRAFCPEFRCSGMLISCHPMPGSCVEVELDYYDDSVTVTGCGKNLYDAQTYGLNIEGYIIDSNGSTSNSTNYRRTDYIPVSHLRGQTVNLNHAPVGSSYPGMAFYDAQKKYISGGKGNAIAVPANACYMRFSVRTENVNDTQLELGTTATDYEPYRSQTWIKTSDKDGSMFTIVPEKRLCHFYVYNHADAGYIMAAGYTDPLILLEKLAKEAGYV